VPDRLATAEIADGRAAGVSAVTAVAMLLLYPRIVVFHDYSNIVTVV